KSGELTPSSYPAYISPDTPWSRGVSSVVCASGLPGDTPAGRQQFEQVLEQRRLQADHADWKNLQRGWCIGSDEFRRELLDQVSRSEERRVGKEGRCRWAGQKESGISSEEGGRRGM